MTLSELEAELRRLAAEALIEPNALDMVWYEAAPRVAKAYLYAADLVRDAAKGE